MNKHEIVLKENNPEIYDKIKNRKNIILISDKIEDTGMIKGFETDNIIKIGFLNEKIQEQTEKYKEAYDIIITNDSSFEFINSLIKEILKL